METVFSKLSLLDKKFENTDCDVCDGIITDIINDSDMSSLIYILNTHNVSKEVIYTSLKRSTNKDPLFLLALATAFPDPDSRNAWKITKNMSKRFSDDQSIYMCERLVKIFNLTPSVVAGTYYEIGGFDLFNKGLYENLYKRDDIFCIYGLRSIVKYCTNTMTSNDYDLLKEFPINLFENREVYNFLRFVKNHSLRDFLLDRLKQYEKIYINTFNSDEEVVFEPYV